MATDFPSSFSSTPSDAWNAASADGAMVAGNPLETLRNLGRDALNNIPVENRFGQVSGVLSDHNLQGSFTAHVEDQLSRTGKIRIAVVDDFSSGATHGTNVEARIRTNAPSYLRDRIEIVRYDVGGQDRAGVARVLQDAAQDAQNKEVVALSISGGLQAYGVDAIQGWIGQPLNGSSADEAFSATAQRAGLTQGERDAWAEVADASRRIPVVTPVWNDGNTTLAALTAASSNGIVTSIDQSQGSRATEVPLFDIRLPAQAFNDHTSQSAPTFIGQALGVVSRERASQLIVPTPRDSGFGNGGRPQ